MQLRVFLCPIRAQILRRVAVGAAALGIMAFAPLAPAEVWGFVDDTGQVHVANWQLDARYHLFFKGEAPGEPASSSPAAPASDASAAASAAPADPAVQRWLNDVHSKRYERLIEQHAARASVDPALVKAIVAVESSFTPTAVSPKGARGLMQVMPQTAARYGVSSDNTRSAEEKLLDPVVNLQVGTRYLRDLLAHFADNIALAIAAYNAGENAVERYKNRIPPYPETREYVKRVQQLYAAFRPAKAATPTQVSTAAPLTNGRIRGTFAAEPKVAQAAADPVL
ncbi:MAG TPA: lytic transglycosylase domain-containing protein [Casimicrobiaceae bacterium]|nr:lytic transglycosylase domain-containing protein [Casimicrobiaceae bacterium]